MPGPIGCPPCVFLLATSVDAVITVVHPLLLGDIIDHGILARDEQVVICSRSPSPPSRSSTPSSAS